MDYDYPFYYRNYYRPVRKVPVPIHRETKPTPKPERKVIHVPVMDGSEMPSRSREESAVMIQKVMRGFLVRKTVKKIAAIKIEVDEMENRIMSEETMELIRKDKKERLKINEMLMRILLKLDSVPGVDFGVRDCRKSVIKKAIRLQEVVDSISDHQNLDRNGTVYQSDPNSNPNSLANNVDQKLELSNNVESQKKSESDVPEAMNVEEEEAVPEIEGNIAKSASESNLNSISNSLYVNRKLESQNNVELEKSEARDIPEVEEKEAPEIIEGNIAKSASESNSNSNSQVNTLDRNEELTENMEEDESQTGSSADPDRDMIIEGGDEDSDCEISDEKRDDEEIEKKKKNEEGRNVELLEKLVDENEKMMGLMADLFKKNEMQTKLLSSLSHRVEHLERALMCELFRRKKKRNGTCS